MASSTLPKGFKLTSAADDADPRRRSSSLANGFTPYASSYPTAEGPPCKREVRVRLNVYDVTEINIQDHTYTMDFFLEVSWEDWTPTSCASPTEPARQGSPTNVRVARSNTASVPSSNPMFDNLDPAGRTWPPNPSQQPQDYETSGWDKMFPFSRSARIGTRWSPRLQFNNVRELTKEEWTTVYTTTEDGSKVLEHPVVCYKIRGRGVFQERFELGEFPVDAQDLQVDIVAMRPIRMIGKEEVEDLDLVKNVSPHYSAVIPTKEFLLMDQYKMCNVLAARQGRTSTETSSSRRQYPRLTLSMKVIRKPRFYVVFVLFPMFLFVALAFPVVLLPITELADRLGLLLTLILTAITFTLFIREHLPKVSYMTKLDQYTIVCYLMIALLCLESSAVYLLSKAHPTADWIDSIELVEDSTACLTFMIWTILHIVAANSNFRDAKTSIEREPGNNAHYGAVTHSTDAGSRNARRHASGPSAPRVTPADGGESSVIGQQRIRHRAKHRRGSKH